MNIRIFKKANLAAIIAATAVLLLVATTRSASFQALPSFSDSKGESSVPLDQNADNFLYGTGVYRGQPAILSFQDGLEIPSPASATGAMTGPSGITSAPVHSKSITR